MPLGNFYLQKFRENTKRVRNFKNFNTEDFISDILQIPWESITLYDNPNVCWKRWKSLYLEVLHRQAPLKDIRIRVQSLS